MRRGGQVWQVQGCLLHTIRSGDALSADGPWGSIQWHCLVLQIVECLIHWYAVSLVSQGQSPVGLPSVVI